MEQTQQNKFLIPLAIVVAGTLIAGAIYFGGGTTVSTNTDTGPGETEVTPVNEKDHVLGSRSAELFIIEYSDTECPFCKSFHGTMKQVLQTYGSRVAWVYRHLPIPQLHARAIKEAEATECAAEQGGNTAFWRYIDEVFDRTSSNDSLDPKELPKIAADIGLDVAAFNTCLNSGKYEEQIKKSIEEGYNAGARGTPYSVIVDQNGEVKDVINGAEPLELVKTKIDALLK